MNILVYDVAAESGGAASILQHYYNIHLKDDTNRYYYVLSTYQLESKNNITVINIPYIKKSWLHRLYFDFIGSKKIINKYKIDEVISLQNIILPTFYGYQTVYLHNALPFSEHRFSLIESPILWIYQNIIYKFILLSLNRADRIIVQTNWMKSIVSKVCKSCKEIVVDLPEFNIPNNIKYNSNEKHNVFFYPANGSIYKNHKVIIEASKILIKEGIKDFIIVFTLVGNENRLINKLKKDAIDNNINIIWKGSIDRGEVFRLYQNSVLVFPSYIETIGLPILEAMQVGTPIIVTNCEYSKSLTKNYDDKMYFDYDNEKQLAVLMKKHLL